MRSNYAGVVFSLLFLFFLFGVAFGVIKFGRITSIIQSLLKVLRIISFCAMWGDLQAKFFFGGVHFLINWPTFDKTIAKA